MSFKGFVAVGNDHLWQSCFDVGFVSKPFPVFLCCSWSCLPWQEMSWWSFWLTRRNHTLSPVLSYQWSEYGYSMLLFSLEVGVPAIVPLLPVCLAELTLTALALTTSWFISWYIFVLLVRWQNLWTWVVSFMLLTKCDFPPLMGYLGFPQISI